MYDAVGGGRGKGGGGRERKKDRGDHGPQKEIKIQKRHMGEKKGVPNGGK